MSLVIVILFLMPATRIRKHVNASKLWPLQHSHCNGVARAITKSCKSFTQFYQDLQYPHPAGPPRPDTLEVVGGEGTGTGRCDILLQLVHSARFKNMVLLSSAAAEKVTVSLWRAMVLQNLAVQRNNRQNKTGANRGP